MPQRVTELHCIVPIDNVRSVMQYGILSYERAAALPHASVAMQAVQDRRDLVQIPGGLKLHQYANLYFHARNPMMYLRQDQAEQLCVLQVSRDVLTMARVVLADQNASSNYVRFLGPQQLTALNLDRVYARDWRSDDRITYYQQKAAKCAEVLVPHCVPTHLIIGAYVVNEAAYNALQAIGFNRPVSIHPDLFFH
ncbi:hypothetical protein J2S82_003682 [Aeromonas caviae]|uniref:DUF4433 domain-containing protein n=1 Tax=Aeromonas caviae TaxID=648 RepID=UPI00209E12B8|nr:DUF4433 domain-containing protein [Aeromonas caviae]MCP1601725.1 hypothetical protein [Aeromonas caviae]